MLLNVILKELTNKREEGQSLIHATVNAGEKVLRATRSDGREAISVALKELQAEWERLVKKISTAKVHLETSLLQWADYSSSYSQLQQWINDREAKLMEVCEQKVFSIETKHALLIYIYNHETSKHLPNSNSFYINLISYNITIEYTTF